MQIVLKNGTAIFFINYKCWILFMPEEIEAKLHVNIGAKKIRSQTSCVQLRILCTPKKTKTIRGDRSPRSPPS